MYYEPTFEKPSLTVSGNGGYIRCSVKMAAFKLVRLVGNCFKLVLSVFFFSSRNVVSINESCDNSCFVG